MHLPSPVPGAAVGLQGRRSLQEPPRRVLKFVVPGPLRRRVLKFVLPEPLMRRVLKIFLPEPLRRVLKFVLPEPLRRRVLKFFLPEPPMPPAPTPQRLRLRRRLPELKATTMLPQDPLPCGKEKLRIWVMLYLLDIIQTYRRW